MDERIIDDELDKAVRLKKTKDGFVSEDELTEEQALEAENAEEIAFEFPEFELGENEEEFIGLPPEEVEARRKQRMEEAAKRRAEYETVCQDGEALLAQENYAEAEQVFAKALHLDDEATEASVGYWRAKTENFTKAETLIDEYTEAGAESMEFDLGYGAVEIIKEKYRDVFSAKLEALQAEESPLQQEVEAKQQTRRAYIKERLKKTGIFFGCATVVLFALGILTMVFGMKNFTTPDSTYIVPTIICGAGTLVAFVCFGIGCNKFLNALRMYRANEKLDSTEDGARLIEIRKQKELYEYFLTENQTEEETENEQE